MELTLIDLVFYLLLGSFLLVPFFSVVSRMLHQRKENQALANRVICRLCLHAFEDSTHVKIIPCPVCEALNEKGRSRKLG